MSRRIAILLAASSLGALPPPASAQSLDVPAARHAAPPKRVSRAHPARKAAEPAPAAAGRSSILGADSDGDSSLERRRRAFFANQPDGGGTGAEPSAPPVGVTLGGSGGVTPGMGLKF